MTPREPENLGDDEQATQIAEYEYYIEDPPEDLLIAEDNDDDAMYWEDWAAKHPKAAITPEPRNEAAEEAAMHEVPEE